MGIGVFDVSGLEVDVGPLHDRRHDAAHEVDVLDPQRRRFGRPQTDERPEQHRRPQVRRDRVVQRPDLLCGGDVGPLLARARRGPTADGAAGEDAVVHGIAEHLAEPGVERVDVGVGSAVLLELRGPGLDVRGPDGGELHRPERRDDLLEVDLGLPHARRPAGSVTRQPGCGPLRHGRPRCLRVYVGPGDDGRGHLVEPLLRVDFPREVPRVLLARGVAVARPPAAIRPLGDASHGRAPSDARRVARRATLTTARSR